MKSLTAYASEQQPLGFFRLFAKPPGGYSREITLFRDAPVTIGAVNTQDPFTESTAQLTFPMITVFDTPGEGDLDWLVPDTDIDIVWQNIGDYFCEWRWEGYIASYGFSLSGTDSNFNLDLKGALYALDDYLAIPSFPKRPIPFEILIAMAFDQGEHPAHLGKFRILWPANWPLVVPPFTEPNYLAALKPWGVKTGDRWTGFVSRNTGGWEPMLTGHVQGMLVNMFAEGGAQWSVRNLGYRIPQLFLRRIPDNDADDIIEIDLGAPGVTMDGNRDFTQRAGVVYGIGKDDALVEYANIQVTPDGKKTYFKPFAYSPRVWPRTGNPSYDTRMRGKEVQLKFQDGIDEVAAIKVAQGQYQRFAEPGITGTVTLSTDPRLSSGELMPRLLIRAGQTIRIKGLFGVREGVLAHITQSTADFTALTTSLTFDTKYRDQLTVEEVKARTRDGLNPLHALTLGKFTTTINDLIIPWSYKSGSGMIPKEAKPFFLEKLPSNATFPYEEWTTKYPPSNPSYRKWYIEITKTDRDNSNNNWSSMKRNTIATAAIPIRMSQAGQIKLTQIAAYDKDGHVMRVKFHASMYKINSTAVNGMPQFPGPRQKTGTNDPNPEFPPYLDARQKGIEGVRDNQRPIIPTTYETANGEKVQTHPFYKGGWETIQPDGSIFPFGADQQLADQPVVVGWGNFYEPAGYWPGRFSKGANRTGLLSDAAVWNWQLGAEDDINFSKPSDNTDPLLGCLYIMIYCDDQDDESVFFMGRFFRTEPGQS